MRERLESWKPYLCYGIWILSTAGLGWLVVRGQLGFDSPATLPVLLVLLICTIVLLWWLGRGVLDLPIDRIRTRWGLFVLIVILVTAAVLILQTFIGRAVLFILPVLALIVLAVLRPQLDKQEVIYALGLALVAGIAGLGAEWVTFPPLAWAGLQVALVLPGLLAGWSLLRHLGLLQAGWGRSLLLAEGVGPALRGLVQGMLLATPWALGLVVLGAAQSEDWVQYGWQPALAIQPAIAEEAWGRMLLVPLLFLVFRPLARSRAVLTAAALVAAYWFAYLHTAGGPGAALNTVMIGTLYTLPISYLWLRRGLETAIGFHLWVDFIKFVAAFLLNQGLMSR